jgi:NitT/TauT family transport system substrate-binding protein
VCFLRGGRFGSLHEQVRRHGPAVMNRKSNRRSAVRLSRIFACFTASALLGVSLLASVNPAMAQEQKLIPLKVGFMKLAGYANIYAAQKENFFRANGLDMTPVLFRSSSEVVAAAQGGAVDIFLAFPSAVMSANERGFDFGAIFQNEIVYDKGPDSGAILVLKDSGIKSLKDLVGKRLAASARSSQATVSVDAVLRQANIDPRQVNYLEAAYPNHYDMLRTRQVDAVAATEPFTTRILSSGIANVISWHYAEAFPGGPLSAAFAKRPYIAQNRDVIDRFNRALKASIDFMQADVKRGQRMIVEFTGLDPALVEKMPYLRYNYEVRPEKWQQVIKIMTDSNILEKPHTPEEYFSDSIKPYIRR